MVEIKNNRYDFSLERIKELSFGLDEVKFDSKLPVLFKLDNYLGYNLEKGLINFTLTTIVKHPEMDDDAPLAVQVVQNLFRVKNFSSYKYKKTIKIPTELLTSIVSVSVAHSRAFFSKSLSGTILDDYLIPVINPVEVAMEFFPESFNIRHTKNQPKALKK